ncbi:Location of vulva defective 1 [Frankliniella fusca]|uniref:Location of vulva defective 1 n=1 Tax=Frankliniella fusca TaxID=407009 RepID=A0AAE1HZ28_9NEOP|nr:Location of vulva defective 1 [Frankliniella fusca]
MQQRHQDVEVADHGGAQPVAHGEPQIALPGEDSVDDLQRQGAAGPAAARRSATRVSAASLRRARLRLAAPSRLDLVLLGAELRHGEALGEARRRTAAAGMSDEAEGEARRRTAAAGVSDETEDAAARPSREGGAGSRLLAPLGSVLKKDSSAPGTSRPVSVKFNLDPNQELRAAALDRDVPPLPPLPPRPMCVRLVHREFRDAVQRARNAEEARLKLVRREYQEELRRARQVYDDMACSREQFAERQRRARGHLTAQVSAARAECQRQIKEAAELHEQRNREIDEYIKARSVRLLAQAKHAYLPAPPPPPPPAPPTAAEWKSVLEAVPEPHPAAEQIQEEEEAVAETQDEEGAVPAVSEPEPVPEPAPRRPWTAPLRSLCRRLVRAAARLRSGAGERWSERWSQRWIAVSGRVADLRLRGQQLARRLRGLRRPRRRLWRRHERTRRRQQDPPPPPGAGAAMQSTAEAEGTPLRRRSTTSMSSQTVEKRVSFAPAGLPEPAPGIEPAGTSWAQEWTQRWVQEAARTGAARTPVSAKVSTADAQGGSSDPAFMVDASTDPLMPPPGVPLTVRTSRMRVELSMRVMGTVGSVQHDPVGSVKSWRRMLYASFVYLKNESLAARLRKRRLLQKRRAAERRRSLGVKVVEPPPADPPSADLSEVTSDKSSALVTRQFVESVMKNVHRRLATTSETTETSSASDEAGRDPVEGRTGLAMPTTSRQSVDEAADDSETYTTPLSESTKNSSVEEVLLRKWNIDEPASHDRVAPALPAEPPATVARRRASAMEASKSEPVATAAAAHACRRHVSETQLPPRTTASRGRHERRPDSDVRIRIEHKPSVTSHQSPPSSPPPAHGAHGETASAASSDKHRSDAEHLITIYDTEYSMRSSGSATTATTQNES